MQLVAPRDRKTPILRLCFLVFSLLFFLGIPSWVKRQTRSVHLSRCSSAFAQKRSCVLSSLSDDQLKALLSQRFFFLNRGAQSFVYASEDGDYVLKLFFFDSQSSLIDRFFFRDQSSIEIATDKIQKLFQSCLTAWVAIEHTALVYLHFAETKNNQPKIRLIGPFTRSYCIDGNKFVFALQKRALPLKDALQEAYQKNDKNLFFQHVQEVFSLLEKRISSNIFNSDRSLLENIGLMGSHEVIEIDFGNYRFEPQKGEVQKQQEIRRYKKRLEKWIKRNTPHWEKSIDEQVSNYFWPCIDS